uniref:Uncharacterized protein n=1 Tax=Tanacetum cinerariifolium TaxID=118510 RepID=A0A699I1V7_TANCI|nr:hypothetical protein [Tanacetum cinerariifolium]
MTIDQQVALDEALFPHVSRLRIGKSNFRLRSDIASKELTLQLVYDVLTLTPFHKAFLVIVDVPEIYMQELWVTATVQHHSIHFKMDNKKRIVNLEGNYLRHSGDIRKITDVNINKLHQPWRSFAAVINKCLSGKSTGYDSLRLSQAQILWGMYHKKNVYFSYLLWEDFVYQVEHKDAKKSNEMYYPRFTKVIIYFFMTKDPSIPRRNKVNSHYVRDDQMFTMIKLVLRHQNTQPFSAILPIELTNEYIRNSAAYKEYYAIASGAAPPKTKTLEFSHSKQSAKSSKAKGLSVLFEVAMTEAEQMKLATKRSLQQTHIFQANGPGADERNGIIPGIPGVLTDESDEEISWKSSDEDDDDEVDDRSDDQHDDDDQDDNDDDQDTDNNGDDFVHPKLSIHEEEAKDEESFDPIVDEGNDEASLGMNVGGEEGQNAEDNDKELYKDFNINLEGQDIQMIDVHTTQEFEDTRVTLTPVNPDGQQQSSSVSSQFVTSMLNLIAPLTLTAPTLPPPTIPIISQVPQASTPPTTAPSTFLHDLLNFGSLFRFDHHLKTLEANFSEFVQTNHFAGAVSFILEIVERYMDQRMNEAVKVAVHLQSDKLRDEAQAENEDFINKLDENIQKITKEQVKEQVKVQVCKILPKIEKTVNEKLEAKVLTRSSNSSKTSYVVAADLSEMELKKILIEKMESNKSIHRSNEQRNLYKALVDAYERDKIILDTYGDTVTLKRRRDDADKDKEPSAGSDRGSKRRREGKEPESTSAPKEKATKTTGKSTEGTKSHQKTASESAPAEEPKQATQDLEEPSHQEFETGAADDQPIA